MASSVPAQPSFDDLGTHLSQVTFCVVDLETTGGGKDSCITEIGAVKVCGGEILGEFQTLVRPGTPIPAMIQVLTGITNQMVATAPDLAEALPRFAAFSAGCVLVAHNAPFDIGFLRRGHEELHMPWPRPHVVDTVQVARQVMPAEEVRNCKLSTLAAHFGATTIPNHRALSDARATVDVLHGLLERVGNLGVHTLEDLSEMTAKVSPDRRAKRGWAQQAPETPGVYWFIHEGRDADDRARTEVLYVGKSTNLRRRVRSYFSAAEKRSRIHEMVRVATGVEFLSCATSLEAEVRELRMIASHGPRYNRRSKNQNRLVWLKLTREAFPRLSAVRRITDEQATHWGPFSSMDAAQEAAMVLQEAFRLRQCTTRLSSRAASPDCALAEMGRCCAPCRLGDGVTEHALAVEEVQRAWNSDARGVLRSARTRLTKLVTAERYEEAGVLTARLQSFHATSVRHHRVRSIAACRQLVAAAPITGGWEIHVLRYGKLAASSFARTAVVQAMAAEAVEAAETVIAPPSGLPAGTWEEAERVAAWLESPGVRLLDTDGEWSWPVNAGLPADRLAAELMGDDHPAPILDMQFGPVVTVQG
ncbi:DEDD exonuclease domain-containing protein [Tessaracoccus sp.]